MKRNHSNYHPVGLVAVRAGVVTFPQGSHDINILDHLTTGKDPNDRTISISHKQDDNNNNNDDDDDISLD